MIKDAARPSVEILANEAPPLLLLLVFPLLLQAVGEAVAGLDVVLLLTLLESAVEDWSTQPIPPAM